MTETILHELNRVPDLNYVKFLDLLGIHADAATAARTELGFELEKLDKPQDPLSVPVPLHTQVAVEDPDLESEVVFETDRTLPGLNAHIGAMLVPNPASGPGHTMVTRYEDSLQWLHGFMPFDPAATTPIYLGLLLRPFLASGLAADAYAQDRLPAGPLDIYVDAIEVSDLSEPGAPLPDPPAFACPPPLAGRQAVAHLRWQVYTGGRGGAGSFSDPAAGNWRELALSLDTTVDLSRSGHLVLELPAGATPLDPGLLPDDLFDAIGAVPVPRDTADLLEVLGEPGVLEGLAGQWEALGVEDPDDLLAFDACSESVAETRAKIQSLPEDQLDPTALPYAAWVQISSVFAVPLPGDGTNLRELYWFRATPFTPYASGEPGPVPLHSLALNTVPATQAATRLEDNLGRTNGRPGQVLALPRTPVLVDPATGEPALGLRVGDQGAAWELRPDFFGSGPEDRHAVLDPVAGTIGFGDGLHGLVPEAGQLVLAASSRIGGGEIGNVPPGTITRIKGRIRNVKAVSNSRAASGGSPVESLEQVIHRAPQLLRIGGIPHTGQDFADLALRTPGHRFHSAHTLPRLVPGDTPGSFVQKDGALTVVVLPASDMPAPQPTAEALRALCAWLEPRRLVTTELHLVGPQYTRVERLGARIGVRTGHDLSAVAEELYAALLDFLHPLRGGPEHTGWPFGYDILLGDVYDVMLAVPGVHRVRNLSLVLAGTEPTAPDVIPLAPGHLPLLMREAIDVVSGYE
ncbi:hypothetical protein GCM10009715_10680 [Paeniglutamicibacter psychrophenolicus]